MHRNYNNYYDHSYNNSINYTALHYTALITNYTAACYNYKYNYNYNYITQHNTTLITLHYAPTATTAATATTIVTTTKLHYTTLH